MIVYKTGDLLAAENTIVVHGCNCRGVMGTGVALAIKKAYPEVFDEYSLLCDKYFVNQIMDDLLGQVQYVVTRDKKRLVVNAFTQLDFGKDRRYTSYDAVDTCFEQIAIKIPKNRAIALGKIGCVSAGGNWNIVKEIIHQRMPEHTINVFELLET